jgi:thiamine biosynthesis lipoprotein
VLTTLEALGYDRTWARVNRDRDGSDVVPVPLTGTWQPRFDRSKHRVAVGRLPIDLGGIGKGLALRWAAAAARNTGCRTFLIDAGGDCVYGHGPHRAPWRIGVEDPDGGHDPVAVLEASDGGCATSATRVDSWRVGGRTVHHLIDPHTGRPGGGALRSVTVAGTDPADAEVWSKVLFLRADRIGKVAEKHGLAALWIDVDGRIGMSSAMAPFVIWQRP